VYGLVCSVFVDRDDFYRLAYEALEDGAANGIRGRLIVDVDKPSGPALAVAVVEMAAACNRDVVIGIGGDNLEAGVDHRALRPAFDLAARLGLHRTIHAGEFDVDTVRVAVRELGCERVDHGVLVMQDPALVTEVVDRGIGFTVCPPSDIEVSKVWPTLAEHSFAAMRAAGILVTLNSDDPTMLRNDLAAEYRTCAEVFGLTGTDLESLSLAGIEASWMDDSDKATMRAEFIAAFRRMHPYEPYLSEEVVP
jgi:adenosine deaminase